MAGWNPKTATYEKQVESPIEQEESEPTLMDYDPDDVIDYEHDDVGFDDGYIGCYDG